MDRKCIGKRTMWLFFLVSLFYILAGFFHAGFCLFWGETKTSVPIGSVTERGTQMRNRFSNDWFGLGSPKTSLEFSRCETYADNSTNGRMPWMDAALYSIYLRVLWVIICAVIGNIIFRKFMQVIYMQKSDGKKRTKMVLLGV